MDYGYNPYESLQSEGVIEINEILDKARKIGFLGNLTLLNEIPASMPHTPKASICQGVHGP